MDLKLKGKTAFISGSTAGIGFAIARSFAKEGVSVILNGRSQASVANALEQLKLEVPDAICTGLSADFSNSKDIDNLLTQLPAVDILVNNVGIFSSESFFESRDADWQKQFEVNVMSGVRLSRHVLPSMLQRNEGRIIFVSSECATLVPTDLIAYSMTKNAILSVARGLANLTKGTRVTVNSIMPGSTLSEGADRFLEDVANKEGKTKLQVEKEFFTNVRTSSLLQRFASVDEIAHTITYLVSPLAAATNGAVIKIEGGSTGGIF